MSSRALKERKSKIKEILPTVRGMDYPYLRRLLGLGRFWFWFWFFNRSPLGIWSGQFIWVLGSGLGLVLMRVSLLHWVRVWSE